MQKVCLVASEFLVQLKTSQYLIHLLLFSSGTLVGPYGLLNEACFVRIIMSEYVIGWTGTMVIVIIARLQHRKQEGWHKSSTSTGVLENDRGRKALTIASKLPKRSVLPRLHTCSLVRGKVTNVGLPVHRLFAASASILIAYTFVWRA